MRLYAEHSTEKNSCASVSFDVAFRVKTLFGKMWNVGQGGFNDAQPPANNTKEAHEQRSGSTVADPTPFDASSRSAPRFASAWFSRLGFLIKCAGQAGKPAERGQNSRPPPRATDRFCSGICIKKGRSVLPDLPTRTRCPSRPGRDARPDQDVMPAPTQIAATPALSPTSHSKCFFLFSLGEGGRGDGLAGVCFRVPLRGRRVRGVFPRSSGA